MTAVRDGEWESGLRTGFGKGLTAAIALMLTSGSALAEAPSPYEADDARRFLSSLFSHITTFHIEAKPLAQETTSALNGLATIDDQLAVDSDAAGLRIRYGDVAIGALPAPRRQTVGAWADTATQAIAIARAESTALRAADGERVYKALADGALSELDAFSRYAGRAVAREQRASREGFGGVGVRIAVEPAGVRVVDVLESTPAERAGLLADDLLTHADGRPLEGLPQADAVGLLRGRVNSQLRLTYRRGAAPRATTVSLRREQIFMPTAQTELRDGALVISLTGFNQHTTAAVAEALRSRSAQEATGVVLDLRGNPGGLLDQAIGVADLFVNDGRLLTTHGRHPDSRQIFDATRGQMAEGLPLVVLINGASASAAEILAAALQDIGRAVVVGAASYGKGTVQTVVRLPNDGELNLTWAKLYAPSGYSFHDLGVLPTVCVNDAEMIDTSARLRDAGQYARLAAETRSDARAGGAGKSARTACAWKADADETALEAAIALAASPSLFAQADALPRGVSDRPQRAAR